MSAPGTTIRVNGASVLIRADANIDDLSDAEYAELDRACEAEEHPIGRCPLCADQTSAVGTATLARDSGDYISDLWGGWGGSLGWRSAAGDEVERNAKLVHAHKVVRSFVSTFALNGTAFDVTFDPSIATAGTDQKGKHIIISPAPALDPTIDAERAGAILTGMALHESYHVRHGRNTRAAIERAFANDPNRAVALKLGNLIDDVRIEREGNAEYPGFEPVFPTTLDYVGQASVKRGEWVPSLDRPIDLAVAAIRYPTFATWTPETEPERAWWQAWSAKWVRFGSPAKVVEAVREGVAHAQQVFDQGPAPTTSGPQPTPTRSSKGERGDGQSSAEPGQQSAPNPEPSESEGASGEQDGEPSESGSEGASGEQDGEPSESQIRKLLRELFGDDPAQADSGETAEGGEVERSATGATLSADTSVPECVADAIVDTAKANGAAVTAASAATAQRAVNDAETLVDDPDPEGRFGTGEVRPILTLDGQTRDWVRSGRRINTAGDPLVERAVRAAMMRSRSGSTAFEHGQARGHMDNGSLTRLAFNDVRLFRRRNAPAPGRYLFWLMVDCSSSMSGQPITDTIATTRSLVDATRYASNVRMAVYGWTTAISEAHGRTGASWGAYRAWGSGEDISRLGDLGRIPMDGTPDAPVVGWAAGAIRRAAQTGERPVVVVLSDGSGYGAPLLREQVDAARRKGVEVLGVAIGHGVSPDRLEAAYGRGRFIPWRGSIRRSARPLGELIARMVGTQG